MKEIYLLSGLGADKRVFDFVDFSGFKVHHIDWIDPQENETIENYVKRLLGQIKTIRPNLIGVSFGGMVTVEIAKLIETGKVILISSAQTKYDIPSYFRIAGYLKLNYLIPTSLLKNLNDLTFWFFGVKTKKEKDLLRIILNETNSKFLKWAIDKIVNWKNTTRLYNVVQIHGTIDRILPLKEADIKIENGGHLMIVSNGEELGNLIRKILS